MKRLQTTVISNVPVMTATYLVKLEAPEIAATALPGQFVMVRCGESNELSLRRPLSLHRVIVELGQIWILFAAKGRGTSWLATRKYKDKLDIIGPLGNGFALKPDAGKILLVAGGIGIAPLAFLAQKALDQNKEVTLALGAAGAQQLYPKNLLPDIGRLLIATEDGSKGHRGMITDLLPDVLSWPHQIGLCGPLAMYRTIAGQIKAYPDVPTHASLEVRMGCGVGACYGCTIKTRNGLKQVCRDGPIFEFGEVLWDEIRI